MFSCCFPKFEGLPRDWNHLQQQLEQRNLKGTTSGSVGTAGDDNEEINSILADSPQSSPSKKTSPATMTMSDISPCPSHLTMESSCDGSTGTSTVEDSLVASSPHHHPHHHHVDDKGHLQLATLPESDNEDEWEDISVHNPVADEAASLHEQISDSISSAESRSKCSRGTPLQAVQMILTSRSERGNGFKTLLLCLLPLLFVWYTGFPSSQTTASVKTETTTSFHLPIITSSVEKAKRQAQHKPNLNRFQQMQQFREAPTTQHKEAKLPQKAQPMAKPASSASSQPKIMTKPLTVPVITSSVEKAKREAQRKKPMVMETNAKHVNVKVQETAKVSTNPVTTTTKSNTDAFPNKNTHEVRHTARTTAVMAMSEAKSHDVGTPAAAANGKSRISIHDFLFLDYDSTRFHAHIRRQQLLTELLSHAPTHAYVTAKMAHGTTYYYNLPLRNAQWHYPMLLKLFGNDTAATSSNDNTKRNTKAKATPGKLVLRLWTTLATTYGKWNQRLLQHAQQVQQEQQQRRQSFNLPLMTRNHAK